MCRVDNAHVRVSTHSRLKAAGPSLKKGEAFYKVSTHSRLKAAGYSSFRGLLCLDVSTHSRLKAAGSETAAATRSVKSFNTQPPEGGWKSASNAWQHRIEFQHTAA